MDQRSPKSSIVNGDWTSFFKICSDLTLRNLKEEETAGVISGEPFFGRFILLRNTSSPSSLLLSFSIEYDESIAWSIRTSVPAFQRSSVPAFKRSKVQTFKRSSLQAFQSSTNLYLFCPVLPFFESVRPNTSTTKQMENTTKTWATCKRYNYVYMYMSSVEKT